MDHLEIDCPSCGHKLRLPTEVAGRRARCPECGTIWEVPAAELAEAVEASAPRAWWLETPEGRRYGPIGRDLLDSWVSEGRVTHDCRISENDTQSWQPAGEYYPVLQMAQRASQRAPHPFAGTRADQTNNSAGNAATPRYLTPHRGGLILTLGLMGWIACPVLAFFAWTLGSGDLQEMREGRMDPSGEGLTRVGYWLGIIQVAICLILLVAGIFIVIIGYAAGAWAGTI